MEYRPYFMAREWVRCGHHVTILAASFSHIRTQNPEIHHDLKEEDIEGVRYIWIKTPIYHGNGLRRAINIFTFVGKLYYYQYKIIDKTLPDAIIASSTYPLDILPASRFARKTGARLVYEVHDLWPLSLIELGSMSPTHPFIMLLQWAENYAYRRSDWVVSILPKAADHMQAHGMAPHKFVFIPNGIESDEWQNSQDQLPKEHKQVIQKLKEAGQFIIGYAGAHGLANALDTLIETARIVREYPVTFILVGKGPEKEHLQALVAEKSLDNLVFLPALSHGAIPTLVAEMDALYIGLKSEPLFRFGVSPNKLIDYMMAGKPVIQAIDAGNDMVKENACGISVPAENPEAIAQAVTRLMDISPEEREAMGLRGKEYVLSHHDYRILAKKFLDIIIN